MPTLGLHNEGKRLYSILLKKGRGKPQVAHFQKLPPEKAPLFVKQVYKEQKGVTLATGLATPEIVTREIRFNLRSRATLNAALPFQIESSVPFSLEETVAYTLFHKKKGARLLSAKNKETFITLLACKEEHLDAHIKEWNNLEIDPDWLSCLPQALHRYSHYFFPQVHSKFIFYMGTESSTYAVIQEGRLVLSKHIPLGSSHHTSSEALPFSQNFKQELARIKTFLERKELSSLPSIFCGEIPGLLLSLLEAQFGAPLKTDTKEFEELKPFAASLGFALDGYYQDKHSVQLRQNTRASKRWRKRFNKMLILYLSTSLIFAALFTSIKSFGFKAKRATLEKKLSTILEKEVSLSEGLLDLERVASAPLSSNTRLNVPNVTDVLQWIGTHPLLKKSPTANPLEISRVQYKLERYPKLGEKKEPYLARVELEITSSSPTAARDFHNALMKGDSLVDEKKEIVWKTSHNAYFTKFYLKKKRI